MNAGVVEVTIAIPEALIPGLREFSGSILLFMDKLHVHDGFTLADDEFVTSVKMLVEAGVVTGFSGQTFATLTMRA